MLQVEGHHRRLDVGLQPAAAADGDKTAPEGEKSDKKESVDKKPADKKSAEEKK